MHADYEDDTNGAFKDLAVQLTAGDEGVLDLDKSAVGYTSALVEFSKRSSDFDGYSSKPIAEPFLEEVFSCHPYTSRAPVGSRDHVFSENIEVEGVPSVARVQLFPTRELVMSKICRVEDEKPEPDIDPVEPVVPASPLVASLAPVQQVTESSQPSRGLESDLVSLLETVIQSQHESLQSQQALVIEALRQREPATVS